MDTTFGGPDITLSETGGFGLHNGGIPIIGSVGVVCRAGILELDGRTYGIVEFWQAQGAKFRVFIDFDTLVHKAGCSPFFQLWREAIDIFERHCGYEGPGGPTAAPRTKARRTDKLPGQPAVKRRRPGSRSVRRVR
jgi:hypothetical protein